MLHTTIINDLEINRQEKKNSQVGFFSLDGSNVTKK